MKEVPGRGRQIQGPNMHRRDIGEESAAPETQARRFTRGAHQALVKLMTTKQNKNTQTSEQENTTQKSKKLKLTSDFQGAKWKLTEIEVTTARFQPLPKEPQPAATACQSARHKRICQHARDHSAGRCQGSKYPYPITNLRDGRRMNVLHLTIHCSIYVKCSGGNSSPTVK